MAERALKTNLKETARLFRSVSTMFNAGIPLHRSLEHLSVSHSGEMMSPLCKGLSHHLMTGHRFSSALARHPGIFSRFVVAMVKVGEKSGKLGRVLDRLADQMEWEWSSRTKLKSAFTYPAFSLVLCFAMVVIAPSYLLRGQLDMLSSSGVELPTITQAVILISDLFHSPIFILAVGLLGFVLIVAWQRSWRERRFRHLVISFATKLPVFGEMLRQHALSRLTRAFGFLLDAGVNASEAIPLAFDSTDDPILVEEGPLALRRLLNGESLADALTHHEYTDGLFRLSLEAAEQTGTLGQTMDWLSGLYAQSAEATQERLVALLEPALMVFTGICVGLILVATLTPTIKLLETL